MIFSFYSIFIIYNQILLIRYNKIHITMNLIISYTHKLGRKFMMIEIEKLNKDWEMVKCNNATIRASIELEINAEKRKKLLQCQDKIEATDNHFYASMIAEAKKINSVDESSMSSYEKFLEVDRLNYGINSINTNYEKDVKWHPSFLF